jgi:N-acetylneuraminic acid mutarotase
MHRSPTCTLVTLALLGLAACADQGLPSGPDDASAAPSSELASQTTNTWVTRASMPTGRSGLVAASVNGRIYAIGGMAADETPLATVEAYNPGAIISPWYPRAPMPAPRTFPSGAAVINGKIYVPGGVNAQKVPTRSLFVYDVAQDKWTTKKRMPVSNAGGGSVAIGGKLYVLTNPQGGLTPSKLYRYNPGTDAWAERAAPGASLAGAVVAAIDGKLYAAGGFGLDGPVATLYVYNPASNNWTTRASMPDARAFAMGRAVGGKLLVAGGYASGDLPRKTLAYDPASNTWSEKADIPAERWMGAAGAVDGLLFVLGGLGANGAAQKNEAFAP